MLASTICMLLLTAFQKPAAGQAQGVTVPVDRRLTTQLEDARELLDSEQSESAVALLQEILEADRSALIHSLDPLLCRGASIEASRLLNGLGNQVSEQRNQLVKRLGMLQLDEALHPPDPVKLQKLATQFAGTDVGDSAAIALHELAMDRGYSAATKTERWELAMPFYQGDDDPSLPRIEAKGLRPLWGFDFLDQRVGRNGRGHRLAFGEGMGFISNGVELTALDLGDGSVEWRYRGAPGWDTSEQAGSRERSAGYNPDTLTIPVLEDGILLAVLEEPMAVGRFDEFNRTLGSAIPVRRKLPARRLYAFDALTGEVLWRQEVPWLSGNSDEPRGLVAAPPAAANGRVFLPVYDAVGTIDLALIALDLYTGRQLWKTYLVSGQQETNLFGNILREMACQPPAADEDKVLFCSNLGTISALEAESGRTIWTRLYDRAEVRTYQNGLEASRDDTFANGLPAYDGSRFLCTPRDSTAAFLINADNGFLLRQWPFYSQQYGQLRNLVAAGEEGAWFHGTRLVYLPYPGSIDSAQVSEPLFSSNGMPTNRYAGALARREILAPAIGGVQVLSSGNLRQLAMLSGLGTRGSEQGPVQTAPGLAFVMRRGGITAFSSPDAILNSLMASNMDAETLGRLLPFLEGIELTDIPIARRIAKRARELAALAPNRDLAERLQLVASRSLHTTGEGADALPLLKPILSSSSNSRRFTAAALALDILETTNPAHSLMDPVLEILSNSERRRIPRYDGRRELKSITIARARVLQGGQKGFGSNAHLDALLTLMDLDGIDKQHQGNMTLQAWGRLQLQNILLDDRASKRLEARAQRAFKDEQPSDSLLQRFAGTQSAWNWMKAQAELAQTDRNIALQVAAWLRNFDWPNADGIEPLVSPELILGSKGLYSIQNSLQVLRTYDLENKARFLGVHAIPGGARILVQEGPRVRLVDLLRDQRKQSPAIRLANDPRSLPRLNQRSFVHDGGATVVIGDQWLNIQMDGTLDLLELPGRTTKVLRLGNLLAMLCGLEDGDVKLQVRDLISGALLLDLVVPLNEDRYHNLSWTGDSLLLLQEAKYLAFSVPLFERKDMAIMQLPSNPTTHQMDQTVALPDGYLLPYTGRRNESLKLNQHGISRTIDLPRSTYCNNYKSPDGFGWVLQSTIAGAGKYPNPTIVWKGSEMAQEAETKMAETLVRFPQLEGFSKDIGHLDSNRLLTFSATERGDLRIRQWDLPADGPARQAWSMVIPDIAFSSLVGRMPKPAAAENGWLLPVKIMASRSQRAKVVTLLLTDDGQLLDRFDLESPTNSSQNVMPQVLENSLLLRHESRIFLLGDPK